jgi:hypothetical protein
LIEGPEDYGYIRLSRKMLAGGDLFWDEARMYSRAEAWVDLLGLASFRARSVLREGCLVSLGRGQLLASERFLCRRWSWDRGRVRRFLALLVDIERVTLNTTHQAAHLGAILTITNYSLYQGSRTTDATTNETNREPGTNQPRTTDEPKRKKEEESIKNEEAGVGGASRSAKAEEPPASALMTFECIKGLVWSLTPKQLREWEETYPSMDVLSECRKARAWYDSHGRKTQRGMAGALVNWFNRGLNSGRYDRRTAASNPLRGQSPDELQAYLVMAEQHRLFPVEGSSLLERFKEALRRNIPADEWLTWIRPLLLVSRTAGLLVLGAPNQRCVYTLEEAYQGPLSEAAKACGLDSVQITTVAAAVAAGGTK